MEQEKDAVPLLLLVTGPPGAGKSTLAWHLARATGATLLDSDLVTEPLFPGDRDSAAYTSARGAIYAGLYALADANLRLGRHVVIDAPHLSLLGSPVWEQQMTDLVEEAMARMLVIYCRLDPAELRARMLARGAPRDDGKLSAWDAFAAGLPAEPRIGLPHVRLDMSRPVSDLLTEALRAAGRDSAGRG